MNQRLTNAQALALAALASLQHRPWPRLDLDRIDYQARARLALRESRRIRRPA